MKSLSKPDSAIEAPTNGMAEAGLAHADDLLATHPGRGAPKREQLEYWLGHFTQFDLLTNLQRALLTRRRTQPARTSSVHTLKLVKVLGPNVLLIATSDA